MNSAVSIRKVLTTDAPIVADIILEMLADAPYAFGERPEEARGRSSEEWQDWTRSIISPGKRTAFLAEDDRGPCGLVCGDGAVAEAPANTVVISRLWVAPRKRGSGLGRRLMEAVTDWAEQRAAQAVGLGVTEMNTGALRFYERLGFRDIGMRIPWPPDPTKQIILMGRQLGE